MLMDCHAWYLKFSCSGLKKSYFIASHRPPAYGGLSKHQSYWTVVLWDSLRNPEIQIHRALYLLRFFWIMRWSDSYAAWICFYRKHKTAAGKHDICSYYHCHCISYCKDDCYGNYAFRKEGADTAQYHQYDKRLSDKPINFSTSELKSENIFGKTWFFSKFSSNSP